jgi:AraC family transcriptional regulator
MIADLNHLVEHVETHLTERIDVADLAARIGTTEYHLRRMFSSLTGMPLTEYVRRRRMTLAAAEVAEGRPLLDVAVAHGYGSAEAFGRAFQAVHGVTPGEARRSGGPFTTQPRLRFRLTIEGNITMDTRLIERPAFALVATPRACR